MLDEKQFLEDLLWTSYRYCIGRHTYVTTLASDMGEYFYDKLSDERKEFIACDIRSSIEDYLRFQRFSFSFDYTVSKADRKPMETLLEFLNKQDNCDNGFLANIKSISVYKKDENIEYEVSKTDKPKYELPIYEHDLLDLLPWMDLASLFDMKNHKILVLKKEDGTLEETECYESYVNESEKESVESNMIILKNKPWKYKKVYRPVEYGVSNRYVEPSFIVEVKNI